jgi:hypothetical protein
MGRRAAPGIGAALGVVGYSFITKTLTADFHGGNSLLLYIHKILQKKALPRK